MSHDCNCLLSRKRLGLPWIITKAVDEGCNHGCIAVGSVYELLYAPEGRAQAVQTSSPRVPCVKFFLITALSSTDFLPMIPPSASPCPAPHTWEPGVHTRCERSPHLWWRCGILGGQKQLTSPHILFFPSPQQVFHPNQNINIPLHSSPPSL